VASDGTTLLDDIAPEMSKISYAIKAKITRFREIDGKQVVLADKSKKIRVIPACDEQPPVDIDGEKDEYVLRKEKDLRKGMFKGKLGRLSMEAVQPKSLRLSPTRTASTCPTTTMATVMLRFDPADESVQPPKLGQLVSKMAVNTYFSSTPMREFPSRYMALYSSTVGFYSETVSLSSRCIESAAWERHTADSIDRRDSGYSTTSSTLGFIPDRTSKYAGKTFYTARILVPITLPKNKTFVPTFFACLVARIYHLELSVSVHSPGTGVPTSTLHLRVPVQISAAGNMSTTTPPSFEAAEIAAADEFFQPRTVAPPSEELTMTSNIIRQSPPGYSFFAGATHGIPVRIPTPTAVAPGCG
jgi:hypothetical protein